MSVPTPPIITCPQWDARKPKSPPIVTGRPNRIIIHHTDGHAPVAGNVPNAQIVEAIDYAKLLQNDMMDNRGWNDSGHNFMVMRSGRIIQGRWGTVTAIEHGRMVISAHCPGQNDQPGIEHEHIQGETPTNQQLAASVWLQAWIAEKCAIRATDIYPHSQFFATDCPDTLRNYIMYFRGQVAKWLTYYKANSEEPSRTRFTQYAVNRELKH